MSKTSATNQDQVFIDKIRQDLDGIKYKMLNELFLQASNNNGVIDRDSSNFKTLKESFLNADPNDEKNKGKAVLSVLATEQGALNKLDKSGILQLNPLLYAEMKNEINSVRADLTKKLDSNKGVQELLADFLKQKSMEQLPFQVLVTQKQGMYDVGDTRPMTNPEVKKFTDMLKPHVDFSGANISGLARDGRVIDQGIGPIIQQAMISNFGKPLPNNPNGYTLDETKLTPEKAKAFGAEVSQKVAEYSQQQAKIYEVMERAFKKVEEKGVNFSPEKKEKIMKSLTSTLNALGSDHLEKNMDTLAESLSDKLKDNRSLFSRLAGNSTISPANLGKIATQIAKEEMPHVEKASFEKLQNQMMRNEIKTADFNSKVQEFAKQQGIKEDLSKVPLEKIAKIRLANPKAFDEIVFSKKPQPNLAKEVTSSPEMAQAKADLSQSKGAQEVKKSGQVISTPSKTDTKSQETNVKAEARKSRPLPSTPDLIKLAKDGKPSHSSSEVGSIPPPKQTPAGIRALPSTPNNRGSKPGDSGHGGR